MFYLCDEYSRNQGNDLFVTEDVADADAWREWRYFKNEFSEKELKDKVMSGEWWLRVRKIDLPLADYEKGYDFLTDKYNSDYAIEEHELETVWDAQDEIKIENLRELERDLWTTVHQSIDYDDLMDWKDVYDECVEQLDCFNTDKVALLQRKDAKEAFDELRDTVARCVKLAFEFKGVDYNEDNSKLEDLEGLGE